MAAVIAYVRDGGLTLRGPRADRARTPRRSARSGAIPTPDAGRHAVRARLRRRRPARPQPGPRAADLARQQRRARRRR